MKSNCISKSTPSSKTYVMPKYMQLRRQVKSKRTIRLRYTDYQVVFKRLMNMTKSRTKTELAEVIGIRPSSVTSATNLCHLPFGWLIKLQLQFGISPHTVLEGFEI